jgi:hypothetical protein
MLGCATKDETQAAIKKRIAKIRRQKMLLNLMIPSQDRLSAGTACGEDAGRQR